jgi:hypothetical protein
MPNPTQKWHVKNNRHNRSTTVKTTSLKMTMKKSGTERGGGQKIKFWTPSPKVVELDESFSNLVLLYFLAKGVDSYGGAKLGVGGWVSSKF